MSEKNKTGRSRLRRIRHTGRLDQVFIYLGKQLRFFINQSDWKVLPMAAIIAGLVGMVIRRRFFVNMEGSLIGAFALTCVALWNGCFNSIQSVCRERPIVKREHRSGMHISAYVTAHMIYQFMLCAAQTALTMFVLRQLSVPIPRLGGGTITPWAICDLGITMFLITYAADMMSLFLSSISRTTTGAMTLMPFILIFQLVFSGGVIPLPAWSRPLSNFTISNYGIRAIAAESGYNEMPMNAVWNTLSGMKNTEVGGSVSVSDILDRLDNPTLQQKREDVLVKSYTVGELARVLADPSLGLRDKVVAGVTVGEVLDGMAEDPEYSGNTVNAPITVGDVVDFLQTNQVIQSQRDKTLTVKATVGELMEIVGEDNVKEFVMRKTAEASRKPEYERTVGNIVGNWLMLGLFILAFAGLATIVLEMIDKDKR
jgi:hypothetical protein